MVFPDNTTEEKTGVLIVGGGPTGLTLANILGHSGVPFVLVDNKPQTIGEPRAVSIDDESLRTMQAVGLSDAVMRDVVPGYGVHYMSRVGGSCFGKVEPTANEYGFPRRNAFRQPLFEATLRTGAERFSCGSVRFGHRLDSFTQDDFCVRALITAPGGKKLSLTARYLVACDGGRSPVREQLGVNLVGSTFRSRWLVIDTDRDTDSFSQMRVYCDPVRPIVDVPGPHKTRRYEILVHPDEPTEEVLKDEVIASWLRPLRGDADMHVVRKTVYTFHARVAEKWQSGRVFLAGDAAHLTPPYAGQGMNSGVRDAHNLGWKLALVIKGQLPSSILASYEQERRKHAWSLIRLALNLGIVMAPSSRFSALAWQTFFRVTRLVPPVRDYFVQMKFKQKPRFDSGLIAPRSVNECTDILGRMFPQPTVKCWLAGTGGATAYQLDDLIGHRFALVKYGKDRGADLDLLKHPLWDLLDVARIQVLPAGTPVPMNRSGSRCLCVVALSDGFENWLGNAVGKVVVVRPDRYVAGAFAASSNRQFADSLASVLGVSAREAIDLETRRLETDSASSALHT